MRTLNIDLTGPLADFIDDKVAAGEYESASELVRDALRLLRRVDEIEAAKLEALRREVRRGLEEADSGQFSTESLEEIAASVLSESKLRR